MTEAPPIATHQAPAGPADTRTDSPAGQHQSLAAAPAPTDPPAPDDRPTLRQLLADPEHAGIGDPHRLEQALAACRAHGWTVEQLRQLIDRARREAKSPRGPGGLVLAMLQRGRQTPRQAADAPTPAGSSAQADTAVRAALEQLGIENPTREQLVRELTPAMEKLYKSTFHGKSAAEMFHWALTEADPSDTVDPGSEKIGVKVNLIRRHLGPYVQRADFEALCAEVGYDEALRRQQADADAD